MEDYNTGHLCKLSNGKIVKYDEAISVKFFEKYPEYNHSRLKFIGRGIIWEVGGVSQHLENDLNDPRWANYFFQKI